MTIVISLSPSNIRNVQLTAGPILGMGLRMNTILRAIFHDAVSISQYTA